MARGANGLILVRGAVYRECEYCGLEFESFHGEHYCGNCEEWRKREYLRERHRERRSLGCGGFKGLVCENCGRTFFHSGPGRAKHCKPCRVTIVREQAAEYYHLRKAR